MTKQFLVPAGVLLIVLLLPAALEAACSRHDLHSACYRCEPVANSPAGRCETVPSGWGNLQCTFFLCPPEHPNPSACFTHGLACEAITVFGGGGSSGGGIGGGGGGSCSILPGQACPAECFSCSELFF